MGNYMHMVTATIFLVSHNLKISLLMIFVMGFGMGGRVFVGYVWMSENMRIKDVAKATAIMFTIDALCILIAALYFLRISKHWEFLYGFPMLIQAFAVIGMLFQYDTPKFYYGTGNYNMARRALTKIGRVNGKLKPDESYTKTFEIELKNNEV
jgi:MFS family permease